MKEEAPGADEPRFSPRPNRAGEIEWRPWGHRAFEEAGSDGKLVLLSISAVWCHWCHVMDETSYSDPGVIEKINRDFIPVRVDSDRRPDINGRYNQGGWPTTAFLTATGAPVAGFTYLPPPQFSAVLDRLSVLYRHRRETVDCEATSMAARQRALRESEIPDEDLDPRTSARVAESILDLWDRGYGGLGDEPKFPPLDALVFTLARFVESGDADMRSFVVSTLDGMRMGELFDRVEGGFFRYATGRDWSAPHYEKMLSDNAELISIYLSASTVFERPDYADTARRALQYVTGNLLDGNGGFYGSQDADEAYYHRDGEGRSRLERPAVDRTIYTDSSARMISALVRAAALSDPDLLSVAVRGADFIYSEGFRPGRGLCHYFGLPDGSPGLWGQPEDQVFFLKSQLDIYQATGDAVYLERALALGDLLIDRYLDDRGRFHGLIPDAPQSARGGTGVLSDVPEGKSDISLNGHGAGALLALEALAPGRGYGEAALRTLKSFAGEYVSYSYFASAYALAVETYLKGNIEVRVAPGSPPGEVREILRTAAGIFQPRKVVRFEAVDGFTPADAESGTPPAVICYAGACRPVFSAEDLEDALTSQASADGSAGAESPGGGARWKPTEAF